MNARFLRDVLLRLEPGEKIAVDGRDVRSAVNGFPGGIIGLLQQLPFRVESRADYRGEEFTFKREDGLILSEAEATLRWVQNSVAVDWTIGGSAVAYSAATGTRKVAAERAPKAVVAPARAFHRVLDLE